MDIKGSNKKESAPTPFNTPRNAAPIQSGGSKKGAKNQPQIGSFSGSFELPHNIQQAMAANPDLAQIVGDKLNSLVGTSIGGLDLPLPIRRRVSALKNLLDKEVALEAQFREEILALEAKYLELYRPFREKRNDIVSGKVEPTAEECEREDENLEEDPRSSVDEEAPEEPKGGKKGGKGGKQGGGKQNKPKEPEVKGIPGFWSTALQQHPLVAETIHEHDLELLNSLVDLRLKYIENNMACVLEFHFAPNQYFNNTLLTKTYYLQNNISPAFDDVIYARSEGCTIDWKQGKDLTVKVETKKQKNKANKKTRIVKKTVPQESFFRFFTPPSFPTEDDEEEEEEDEENGPSLEERIDLDFELGEVMKSKIIPRAVHWFTGEALEYEDDGGYMDEDYDDDEEVDYDGEDMGDEDDDDEDDNEDDDDDDGEGEGAPAATTKPGEKPAECAQQ